VSARLVGARAACWLPWPCRWAPLEGAAVFSLAPERSHDLLRQLISPGPISQGQHSRRINPQLEGAAGKRPSARSDVGMLRVRPRWFGTSVVARNTRGDELYGVGSASA